MDFEKVRDVIVETLGCDAEKVTPEASLTKDLGADSLTLVELVMSLEEAAGISIELTRGTPAAALPVPAAAPAAPVAPAVPEAPAITAPLVGTYYAPSAPDQPLFRYQPC